MLMLFRIFLIVITSLLANNIFAANGQSTANRDPFQPINLTNQAIYTETTATANLTSILLVIKYAKAEDIGKILTAANSGFLSGNGIVSIDARTNAVWIRDDQDHLKQIKKFIGQIDIPVKQVEIAARIINADDTFARELGIKFGTVQEGSKDKNGLSMGTPLIETGTGHFNFAIAKLGNDMLLDMEISALESEGRGKVISSPKLITLNRQTAHIESGEDVPYQQRTGDGNTDVAFKKAVLGLKVTPEIVSDNQLLLNILVTQDTVSPIEVEGVPAISTREIETKVLASTGQTIVLGGIYEESYSKNKTTIPYLGAIPVLGWLFTSTTNQNQHKELLIFITPKILSS